MKIQVEQNLQQPYSILVKIINENNSMAYGNEFIILVISFKLFSYFSYTN